MPNTINPCPSAIDLAHPESIVSRCHVSCGKSSSPQKTAGQMKAGGIPVSPLPGEAGQALSPPPPLGYGSPPGAGETAPNGVLAPPLVVSQPLPPTQQLGGQPAGVAGTENMNASPVGRLNEQGVPITVNAKVSSGRRSIEMGSGRGLTGGLYTMIVLFVRFLT